MHQETPFEHHLTSSQDLNDTPSSVMYIILYPDGNYCKNMLLLLLNFAQCFYECIFSGAWESRDFQGVKFWSQWARVGDFLMGRQSHFNVPQEHVTAVPLFHPWPS